MQILSWFRNRRARKTITAAGRVLPVEIEEMVTNEGETIEVDLVTVKNEDEAWDALAQGMMVTGPRELFEQMGIDDEAVTHEEFVDGIVSDRMWAEEEKRRVEEEAQQIPASWLVQPEEARA